MRSNLSRLNISNKSFIPNFSLKFIHILLSLRQQIATKIIMSTPTHRRTSNFCVITHSICRRRNSASTEMRRWSVTLKLAQLLESNYYFTKQETLIFFYRNLIREKERRYGTKRKGKPKIEQHFMRTQKSTEFETKTF
jgi:hypothetical protein